MTSYATGERPHTPQMNLNMNMQSAQEQQWVSTVIMDTASVAWNLDDDTCEALLDRFSALLSSSSNSVKASACQALSGLLKSGDGVKRAMDRTKLVQDGALRPLVSISGGTNTSLARHAGQTLLQLVTGLSAEEYSMFLGLDSVGLNRLQQVVSAHSKKLKDEIKQAQQDVEQVCVCWRSNFRIFSMANCHYSPFGFGCIRSRGSLPV